MKEVGPQYLEHPHDLDRDLEVDLEGREARPVPGVDLDRLAIHIGQIGRIDHILPIVRDIHAKNMKCQGVSHLPRVGIFLIV